MALGAYLVLAKQRKPSSEKRRQGIKKQLQYIRRNLSHIEQLINQGSSLTYLSKKQYKNLLVIHEIVRQQQWLYENRAKRIENRIVSLSQPHLRPIVRGKAGTPVEFGAKLSASCFEGYVYLDYLSWDNYNESKEFQAQVEAFKTYTGYYPESVHVDQIYRTRENRAWCKVRGIRMSGPPLGRPKKSVSLEEKKPRELDEKVRNEIDERPRAVERR